MYDGAAPQALDFFDKSGFPCPALENPADHFLDVSQWGCTTRYP
jgi:ATP-binding cassette subfamily G (WHITE) protein 2